MAIGRQALRSLVIVIFLEILIFTSVDAQDLTLWENKWFSITYKQTGYCQMVGDLAPFPSGDTFTAYMKTGAWDSSTGILQADLHYFVDGEWTSMTTPLQYILGNELDFICSSGYVGDPTIGFGARITGKLTKGELKSGTFKTLWAFSFDTEGMEHCAHSLSMNGKLTDESKVPLELK